ncbi:hypothetical protein Csa_014661, partial [Cucumis sativus]
KKKKQFNSPPSSSPVPVLGLLHKLYSHLPSSASALSQFSTNTYPFHLLVGPIPGPVSALDSFYQW